MGSLQRERRNSKPFAVSWAPGYKAEPRTSEDQLVNYFTMPSAMQTPEFQIPVVDISAYLEDPSSRQAQSVVDSVRAACITSGFFQLKGHGIPGDLREALFQGAKALFALPLEEKKALKRPGTNRGYDVMGAQALQQDALPDMKEVFNPSLTHSFRKSSQRTRATTLART